MPLYGTRTGRAAKETVLYDISGALRDGGGRIAVERTSHAGSRRRIANQTREVRAPGGAAVRWHLPCCSYVVRDPPGAVRTTFKEKASMRKIILVLVLIA